MLSGCAGSSGAGETTIDSQPSDNPGSEKAAEAPAAQEELPVIEITTKNTSSTDFADKPVNGYVSGLIASWTPDYKIPPEPYYEECFVTLTDGGSEKTVLIDSADAEVKVRGNWTTTYPKKPFRIKFAEKQSMPGLNDGGEYKNWLLLAEYKDFSMLRNKTAFKLAEEILGKDGYYTADSKLVEVKINGKYWGVYLLTEQQQANGGRVDIAAPEKDYTGTDIGYFLEYDGYYHLEEPLNQFRISYHDDGLLKPYDGRGGSGRAARPSCDGKNDVGYTIKSDIYSQEQHDFIANYMENTYNIMYEAAMNDKAFVISGDGAGITEAADITPREAVERVVDVRSLADAYILAELTCDADIYWSSFYMDVDMSENGKKKLVFEAPWDFDSALGNKERFSDDTGYYAGNLVYDVNGKWDDMCNPWLMVLMNEDWYQDIIRDRWTELSDSGVFDGVYNMISDDAAKYESAFKRNYDLWDNIRYNEAIDELAPRAAACKTEKESAEYLRGWLEKRVSFMDTAWHK
ncbi:MAG: CotH kinase family protein [Ruminococcus sp.]|nr:CotH kinase family protein [Ruminococcus sp.]